MSSKTILSNVIRLVVILLLQILVMKRIIVPFEGRPLFHILIYPLFIMILPLKIPRPALMLMALAVGLLVDLFYTPLGIHAGALVFMAYMRPRVLRFLAPADGYNMNYSPTIKRMGRPWFFKYAAILLFLHTFFYFSLEAYTFVYIVDILWQTATSFIISMIFIVVVMLIANPQD